MNSLQKAEPLRKLHPEPEVLVLPNARTARRKNFSEGRLPRHRCNACRCAFSVDYADAQFIPQAEMDNAVRGIARCVRVRVTADLEAGYGDIAHAAAAL